VEVLDFERQFGMLASTLTLCNLLRLANATQPRGSLLWGRIACGAS
jgi:hypothetical protein